jgi:hypothetical protein
MSGIGLKALCQIYIYDLLALNPDLLSHLCSMMIGEGLLYSGGCIAPPEQAPPFLRPQVSVLRSPIKLDSGRSQSTPSYLPQIKNIWGRED